MINKMGKFCDSQCKFTNDSLYAHLRCFFEKVQKAYNLKWNAYLEMLWKQIHIFQRFYSWFNVFFTLYGNMSTG